MDKKLKEIKGQEIFSVGTWNGDKYTEEDLDEIVRAFTENKDTFKPPLKLGHDEQQKILQSDGYPAAGWIGNVYRKGEKLLADFIDIPEKIYEILMKGAYKKKSAEIYWGIEVGDKSYNRMLAGVALLGADMPAVLNLNDIMEMYVDRITKKISYTNEKNKPNLKTYNFSEVENMDAKELKAMQDKIDALEAQVKENADLKSYKSDADSKLKEANDKIAALEAKNREGAIDRDLADISASQKVSPAMKPYIKALLGEEKKSYSVGEKKDLSKFALLSDLLSLHAEALKLNTTEKSVDGERISQEQDLDAKIRAYMKEKQVSYTDAYKAIGKKQA